MLQGAEPGREAVSEHLWPALASSPWTGWPGRAANCACPVVSGLFQCSDRLLLTDQAARQQLKEFARKNAANALSVANMVMGMASILSSLSG